MLIETAHEIATATSQSFAAIQRLYGCRKGKAVLEFLAAHAFLIPILEEVAERISDYFISNSKPVLEVTTDPEAFDSRTLFVFIQTHLPLAEALRQLDRFDEAWWLQASERANGKLCIDVECI